MKIARRAFVKLFGIVGFLLALIGGVTIAYGTLSSGGLSASSIAIRLFELVLGVGAIFGGLIIYTGPMRLGGLVTAFAGVILAILMGFAWPATLVLAGGILGIIGASMKPAWWMFWKR